MKLHRSLCLPIFLTFAAVSSAWQGPPPPSTNPCLPYDPSNTIDWPTNPAYGSAASLGRTVIGQFSSDSPTDRDAVILAGGVAVHSKAAAAYKLILPITFPTQPGLMNVVDVDVLPGGGPDGTDTLLATDSRGLLKTVFQPSGSDPLLGSFSDPTVIEGSAWVNARPIHVVDIDGQGGLDIIGVAAGGTTLLTLIESSGSYLPGTISVPRAVLDVVAANYFPDDAQTEYVALTTGGLYIYNLAGTVDGYVPHGATAGAITRVTWPTLTGVAEFIAWGRPKAGGGGELVVLGDGVNEVISLNPSGCHPVSFVPTAVRAGYYNFDDFEDLLLVHAVDRSAIVLVNNPNGSPAHFSLHPDWHDVIPLDPSSFSPGGVGLPAFDQIDGVGPDDLAIPVRATAKVQVFLNINRYRYPGDPGGNGQPATSADVIDNNWLYGPEEYAQLLCGMRVPSQYAGYEYVQIILWKEPSTLGGVSQAIDRRRYPLDDTSLNQYAMVIDGDEFPVNSPSSTVWDPRPYYYLELRFIDGTSVSPRYFAGMTLRESENSTQSYQHLVDQGMAALRDLKEGYDIPTDSGAIIGAYVPMSSQPAFANGQQPQLPPLVIDEQHPTWRSDL